MKKYAALLTLALVSGAMAQQQIADNKPSAAVPHKSQTTQQALTPTARSNGEWALPVGTAIKMKLETTLASFTSKRGDRFGGRVVEPVRLNGKIVIPVGSAVEGDVAKAEESRRIRGTGTLDLLPRLVTLPDGKQYRLTAVVVDTSNRPAVDVNDEGEIKADGFDRTDKIETAAAAGVGAGIGVAAGGGKGMLIGATIGAGAAVVHWLTKTKSAILPSGTEIVLELSRPMQLSQVEGD
ncbi:MAG TPA: hypothetical protein VN577_11150 [Terriglobales bacterium]|nr:hypothetical protein [Terriglobales bacterium]